MLRAALLTISAVQHDDQCRVQRFSWCVRVPPTMRDRGSLSQGQDAVAYGADTPRCKFSSTHTFAFCSVINLLARMHCYEQRLPYASRLFFRVVFFGAVLRARFSGVGGCRWALRDQESQLFGLTEL